jgi:hypothetical protein
VIVLADRDSTADIRTRRRGERGRRSEGEEKLRGREGFREQIRIDRYLMIVIVDSSWVSVEVLEREETALE